MNPETRASAENNEQPTCKTCKHFRQHYIKYGRGSYQEISYGHCVHPRLKKRESTTKACEHFQPRAGTAEKTKSS